MLAWKHESNGQYALIIEGARRIGKSTIVEEFAKNEYDEYLLIDFSIVGAEITELFSQITDLNRFFLSLQTIYGKSLPAHRSVIIFDEVQFCPKARQAIKHLVKDGRYDYIETGSLISIKKNVKDILIPSEEKHIDMHPMDFEEFLWAINKQSTYELIRSCYNSLSPLGEAMNRAIMRDFRLFMLVGGMPQAVDAYLEHNNFAAVDEVKRNILALYDADFRKIDPAGRASTFFKNIPSELARNSMRYKVGSVIEGAKPSRLGELFADIADSKTVNMAFHADDPGVGFAFHANFDFFKMFLADTGLFVSLIFKDKDYTDNDIYRKLLSDKLSADLGYLYENVVAQQLVSSGNSLYYYTFKKEQNADSRPTKYEIDFLISRGDKICPIEVKSSGYKSHKSLDEFQNKYSSRIKTRYLLYTKDLHKDGDIVCLPIYMAGLL